MAVGVMVGIKVALGYGLGLLVKVAFGEGSAVLQADNTIARQLIATANKRE